MASTLPTRAQFLAQYARLLRTIKKVPDATRRAQMWDETRREVRQHAQETDPSKIDKLWKKMSSKIQFIEQMEIPRGTDSLKGTAGTYSVKDGNVVKVEDPSDDVKSIGKAARDWDWRDPVALQRHNQLLRRQYFGRDPPKIKEMF
eukprot:TRINITY_DN6758_c0_g1_i1.p1 TRINITY_DN6758_c0_g1~~TRINITY_DN6758_c0_g1_i1.p1  ORF type:complete len:146 (-),score=30.87 TRINITY_DN6758_c0_g1_i1:44-481(-)